MGYRSDVGVLIYPTRGSTTPMSDDTLKLSNISRIEKYEALKTLMGTTFKHVDDAFGDCVEWLDDRHTLKFFIEYVKWYPDYPDVSDFMRFLDCIQDLGYEYEFMRIGEDADDVEEQRTPDSDYNLSLHRTISFD